MEFWKQLCAEHGISAGMACLNSFSSFVALVMVPHNNANLFNPLCNLFCYRGHLGRLCHGGNWQEGCLLLSGWSTCLVFVAVTTIFALPTPGGRRALHSEGTPARPWTEGHQHHHELSVLEALQPRERVRVEGRRRSGQQLGSRIRTGWCFSETIRWMPISWDWWLFFVMDGL